MMNIYIKNAALIGIRQLIVVLGVWLANRGLTLTEDQQAALANIVGGVVLALIGFLWSNVAKRKDQANPDPAKTPSNPIDTFRAPYALLLLLPCIGFGCSPFYPGSAYVASDEQTKRFVDPYLTEAQANHLNDAQQIQDVSDSWNARIEKAKQRKLWPWEK